MVPESWSEYMSGFFSQQGTWSGIVPWAQQSETPVHKKSSGLARTISSLKAVVGVVSQMVDLESNVSDMF
jgi:hypothetical protein